ncbi:MAG TPA: DUF1501 domain-containing protein [Tepidisphaeraceae bacterium]|nr:DUF1501 domain-containing protein [Tepidisphaeraceae bacterium]
MSPYERQTQFITRRHFLSRCNAGLGALTMSSFLGKLAMGASAPSDDVVLNPMAAKPGPRYGRAKRVIYLDLSGAPPQHDLFDYKPTLNRLNGTPCPREVFQGERFAFIKGTPKLLGSPYKFAQYGNSGAWISELLPNISQVADKIAIVKSMYTEEFNHAPAEMLLYTGNRRPGYASMGSWITYGLGSTSQNLPGFVVLVSGGTDPTGGKSLWSSGMLPSVFQGVQCRSKGEPILYVSNPKGMDRPIRRDSLDALKDLNEMELAEFGDPETLTRISQYELAYRMQMEVPEVMDISKEPQSILDMYGAKPGEGSFANNCLLARRLIESGVRYVQLFDWGWDCHGTGPDNDITSHLPKKCKEMDPPAAALIKDLEQRGLLEDTLIVWGGEFGRTPLNEERNGSKFLGRDHHPHAFTVWMAGGGIKGGIVHGETDDLGYHVVRDKMHVHDLQATILAALGFDAQKFSYPSQGLNVRLIGPADGWSVQEKLFA